MSRKIRWIVAAAIVTVGALVVRDNLIGPSDEEIAETIRAEEAAQRRDRAKKFLDDVGREIYRERVRRAASSLTGE